MEYRLEREDRKSILLRVLENKEVVIKAPLYLSRKEIDVFVGKHNRWINKRLSQIEEGEEFSKDLKANSEVFLFGEKYKVFVGDNKDSVVNISKREVILGKRKSLEDFLKEECRKEVHRLSLKWKGYNEPNRIFLKKQKTIWGSCSNKGNININYLLIKAPSDVLEYVYIHELVHLKFKNHSTFFWNEVKRLLPEYEKSMTWLKDNGHFLFL